MRKDIPTAAREMQAAICEQMFRDGILSAHETPDPALVSAANPTMSLVIACDAMDAACVAVERTLGVEPYEVHVEYTQQEPAVSRIDGSSIGTLAEEADAWFGALMDYVEWKHAEETFATQQRTDIDAAKALGEYRRQHIAALRNLRNHTARVRESVR